MLKMQMGDGTSITVTGEEAKTAVGTFSKVIYEHSLIAKTYSVAKQIKKDTTLLVRNQLGEERWKVEKVTLVGTRLAQFRRVLEISKKNPGWSAYRVCVLAMKEVKGEDGYASIASLHRYCLDHESTLMVARKGKITI